VQSKSYVGYLGTLAFYLTFEPEVNCYWCVHNESNMRELTHL